MITSVFSNSPHYALSAAEIFYNTHLLEHYIREPSNVPMQAKIFSFIQLGITAYGEQLLDIPSFGLTIRVLLSWLCYAASNSSMWSCSPQSAYRFKTRMKNRVHWVGEQINWGKKGVAQCVDLVRNWFFPRQPQPQSQQSTFCPDACGEEVAKIVARGMHDYLSSDETLALMQTSKQGCQVYEAAVGKKRRNDSFIKSFCNTLLSKLGTYRVDRASPPPFDCLKLDGSEVLFVQRLVRFSGPEKSVPPFQHPQLGWQIRTETCIQKQIREGITEDTTIDTLNNCPGNYRLAVARQVLGSVEELKNSRQVADFLIGTEGLPMEAFVQYFPNEFGRILRELERLLELGEQGGHGPAIRLIKSILEFGSPTTKDGLTRTLVEQIQALPETANKRSHHLCRTMLIASRLNSELLSENQIKCLENHIATGPLISPNTTYLLLKLNNLDDILDRWIASNEMLDPTPFEAADIANTGIRHSRSALFPFLKDPVATWPHLDDSIKLFCIKSIMQHTFLDNEHPTIVSIAEHLIEHGELKDHCLLIKALLGNRNYWELVGRIVNTYALDSEDRNLCIDAIKDYIYSKITDSSLPFSLLEVLSYISRRREPSEDIRHMLLPVEAQKVYRDLTKEADRVPTYLGAGEFSPFSLLFAGDGSRALWQLATSLCALDA